MRSGLIEIGERMTPINAKVENIEELIVMQNESMVTEETFMELKQAFNESNLEVRIPFSWNFGNFNC